ncbi:hypothetical protein BH10BDE1_BH10BDE1_33960 [soil metagenome]
MKESIQIVGILVLSVLTFVGCSPDTSPVTSKVSAASTGVSNAPPSSTISGGTPAVTAIYTRGALYGSCLRSFGSSFQVTAGDVSPTAPIQGCSLTQEPTCASGFQLVTESLVQMNCSSAPSLTNVQPCYWKSQKCVKLAGADASEVYVPGASYGVCFRQLDKSFQPTFAEAFAYPVSSCAATGTPTCAAGFKMVSDTPVQMNCSATPSSTFEPCYFQTQRCIKL